MLHADVLTVFLHLSARSVSLLQQNTIITIETCCIIHSKVCCNGLMQQFLATQAHRCNDLLQHVRIVATPAFCFDHVITYIVMSYVFQRNKKKHTAKHYTVSSLEGHRRGRAKPGKRPLSSPSVKKENQYAGGGHHCTKPRVATNRRCTT